MSKMQLARAPGRYQDELKTIFNIIETILDCNSCHPKFSRNTLARNDPGADRGLTTTYNIV
jgi:hypothetical protein